MLIDSIKNLFKDRSEGGAETKSRQRLRLLFVMGVGIAFFILVITLGKGEKTTPKPKAKIAEKVTLASETVDIRDVWSNRLLDKSEQQLEDIEGLRLENKLLQERMDILESLALQNQQQQLQENRQEETNHMSQAPIEFSQPVAPPSTLAHMSIDTISADDRNVENYVVAGTYSQASLMSGLVVSTAVSSQSNPQPVALRLMDSGNLPRGWKSKIKDAVLIGSCYGDLSSERALCRINTLSFVEEDGNSMEIKVEGWIFGEDGAPGLKGEVVDRAGEVARESLVAGILGGLASFVKQEAKQSVYPVSPFGQTDALKGKDLAQGALSEGAGNALEKLADFSIKRAEAMQPVIVVNGGRRVDVLFKKGFALNDKSKPIIKVGAQS